MRHQDVAPGFIHTPFNWIVADATARGALTGLAAGDVNKVALQLSDASLWVLTDADGTWTQVTGGSAPGTIPTLDEIPAPVADVGLNQKKLTNVGDATNPRDAVNLEIADGRYIPAAQKAAPDGVASLDDGGQVPLNQLGNAPGGGGEGAVDSVNGQTGVVELGAADVGADPAGTASSEVETAVKTAGATVVNHGATASTARPSGWGFVIWVGSVQPTNIQTQDLWIDTSS